MTRTRWAATTAALAVVLTVAVIGPGVAGEVPDPSPSSTRADTTDDADGASGSTALERRRGSGHAYGLTERPADGGGLARGHAKNRVDAPGLSDPASRATAQADRAAARAERAADRAAARAERAAEREAAQAARGTPDHTHGKGKPAGHSHGDSLAPGHVHPADPDDAADDTP